MSAFLTSACSTLLDSSGNAVGIIGIDGREWAFPAVLVGGSESGMLLAASRYLFDPVTLMPVGILSNGREWIFAAPFIANAVGGLQVGKRFALVNAAGQPQGIRSGPLFMFPTLPVENGGVVPGTPGLPARAWSVSGQMQMGMNTSAITSYTARQFANIVYNLGPWAPVNLAGGLARVPGAWSQNQGALVGDGDGSGTDSKYFRAEIAQTAYGLPAGTYTVFNPSGQEIGIGAASSLYLQAFTTAKYFTFTYTPSSSGIHLWSRRSLANTGAGNVQIILPGCVGDGTVDTVNGTYGSNGTFGVSSGNPWNPDFLTFCSGLKLQRLRWMPALGVIGSVETDWADRVLPTSIAFISVYGRTAVPHEMVIDFSNRMGIDPWINVSAVSTVAYWTSCAALYKAGLNTNRRLLPEYTNETWNSTGSPEVYNDVAYLQFTKHFATVSDVTTPGAPIFYAPAHGRSVGDSLSLLATRENALISNSVLFYMQQGYAYLISAVPDADHFTLNLAAQSRTVPTGLVNIQYAWTNEPGKSISGSIPDQNYATQQLALWDVFDAALGVSRVVHSCASQAANSGVTSNRMATGAMAARAEHVHVAPYYNGLCWTATFTGGGSRITPSIWANFGGTVYFGVYAAGSTPSTLDIARGAGTGFIAGNSQAAAAGATTTGTAVTGLTDGTNYACFAVFKETSTGFIWKVGTGTDALNPANALSTVAAGAQNCYDTFVNQAARCRLSQVSTSNEVVQKAAIATAGGAATLIGYEGGPDFGLSTTTAMLLWLLDNYFPSTVHAGTFTNSANHMARVGYRGHNHYTDIQGGNVLAPIVGDEFPYDLVPNQLYSATAVDGRYAALAAFNGAVIAQSPIPSTVSASRVATPITSAPGSFPSTIYAGLPAGYTYSIVSGDWTNNFGISGTNVVMLNATGLSFTGYSPETLTIEANDGFSSVSFKLSVPIGSAWYESDASFVWDSVGASAGTSMTPPANPPFAAYGSALTEVTGTGNPVITSSSGTVTNDLWKMATYVFANATAQAANTSFYDASNNPIALLVAHILDIGDQATTSSQYELGISSGSSLIKFGTPSNAASTVWYVYANSTVVLNAISDGTCPAKGTKAVHWCFVDPANNQIITGINQTVGVTTPVTIPTGGALGRDVRIGSNNGQATSFSQMYHGSLQILSRAGLTLAQVKTIIQNMQTHHGI